jgi:hypothetical protein
MLRRGSRKVPEYGAHVAMDLPKEPDLLQRLNYEHRQIRQLFADLQRAHGHRVEGAVRPEPRLLDATEKDLAHMLVELLGQHEAVELEVLYPAAARVMSGAWADDAVAEHEAFRTRLAALDGENPEDEAVYEDLCDVMTRVLAHIDEEEKIVFPAMRMDLPPADLAALRHPGAFEMLLGPPPPPPKELSAEERRELSRGDHRADEVEDEDEDEVIDLSDRALEPGGDDIDLAELEAPVEAQSEEAAAHEVADGPADGAVANGNGDAEGDVNGKRRRLIRRR